MKIFVDADGCPVVKITEEIAKEFSVPVIILCDTNHVITSLYNQVIVVGAGTDAVDIELINRCCSGDIVVTQDYGVAALALGKGAYAIHQNGNIYTNENIDDLLMSRYINKKTRMSKSKHNLKGPRKRTEMDDKKYITSLRKMLTELCSK